MSPPWLRRRTGTGRPAGPAPANSLRTRPAEVCASSATARPLGIPTWTVPVAADGAAGPPSSPMRMLQLHQHLDRGVGAVTGDEPMSPNTMSTVAEIGAGVSNFCTVCLPGLVAVSPSAGDLITIARR
ncbi:hypothetical protein [Amycolatopsis viridis]|uniref:Uncharacterized protein n=1 Tax=Amycolatopsis viridis TaxID=185678 RepID=A0ABX0SNM0_9PSEU|nr:hypothetical protein [Amycolatopsis viridis]NIH78503.1 hypothetical protein [Amycolatopsis viridis]